MSFWEAAVAHRNAKLTPEVIAQLALLVDLHLGRERCEALPLMREMFGLMRVLNDQSPAGAQDP
jgi:hypothetical protein